MYVCFFLKVYEMKIGFVDYEFFYIEGKLIIIIRIISK